MSLSKKSLLLVVCLLIIIRCEHKKDNSKSILGFSALYLLNSSKSNFTSAGNMSYPRAQHTATLLSNGKVIIIGGSTISGDFNARTSKVEIYDPSSNSFSITGDLLVARTSHSAMLLNNGKILVAGGYTGGSVFPSATAALYDPSTGVFTNTGSMTKARSSFASQLLSNGKVIIMGGDDGSGTRLATTELYDPSTGAFTSSGNMIVGRSNFASVTLSSGKILVMGGYTNNFQTMTSEIYDPTTGSFTSSGNMNIDRSPSASILLNGKVLVTGGNWQATFSELYDPSIGTFSKISDMIKARESGYSSVLLNSGKVLIAGAGSVRSTVGAETFDVTTSTFSSAGNMILARDGYRSVLLNTGKVLYTGGYISLVPSNNTAITSSCEIYTP